MAEFQCKSQGAICKVGGKIRLHSCLCGLNDHTITDGKVTFKK